MTREVPTSESPSFLKRIDITNRESRVTVITSHDFSPIYLIISGIYHEPVVRTGVVDLPVGSENFRRHRRPVSRLKERSGSSSVGRRDPPKYFLASVVATADGGGPLPPTIAVGGAEARAASSRVTGRYRSLFFFTRFLSCRGRSMRN